jgi:hypothetical protein
VESEQQHVRLPAAIAWKEAAALVFEWQVLSTKVSKARRGMYATDQHHKSSFRIIKDATLISAGHTSKDNKVFSRYVSQIMFNEHPVCIPRVSAQAKT